MTPILALLFATTTPAAVETPPAPPPVEIHGEVRVRGESLSNLDLNDDAVSTGSFWGDGERVLLRSRLAVDAKPTRNVQVYFQLQDSRLFGEEPTTAASLGNVDLHQGWVELHDLFDQPFQLRLGRMELSYGDQRLIGAFGWDNVGRAFDGVKGSYRVGEVQIDAFYTRLHANPWHDATRIPGDDFAGLYGMWRRDGLQVDAYLLALYDRGGYVDTDGDGVLEEARMPNGGDLQVYTPGVRVDVKPEMVPGLHFNGEFAYQFGNRGDLDVSAWAVHAAADYTLPVFTDPAVILGYDRASGDSDPGDDTWGTFENLFPTNHDKYGLMDLASWKNLQDIYFGAGFTPLLDAMRFQVTAHLLSRASEKDTFYRANGSALRPLDAALRTDARAMGTELDFTLDWKVTKNFAALFGFSYLWAGEFLDETAPGGEAPNASFAYLQLTGSF